MTIILKGMGENCVRDESGLEELIKFFSPPLNSKQNTVTEAWPCKDKRGGFLRDIENLKEQDFTPRLLVCSGDGDGMEKHTQKCIYRVLSRQD